MGKYRFKTKEEFIRDGLWDKENNCPDEWSYEGHMNKYLGKDVPDDFNVYCDKKEEFEYDGWEFINTDYVLKEQQKYFDDLSQHIGRYIRALVDNPHGGNTVKKGDIGKIITKCHADFPNRKSYACTLALSETHLGVKYELLPEDYSPEQEDVPERISFYVKYTEEFTEDLYNALWEWSKKNSEFSPRNFAESYEGLKQHRFYIFDNWTLHPHGKYGGTSPNKYSYGVNNNKQNCEEEYTIEQVKKLIGYKEPILEFIPGKWYKYNRWYIKYKEHIDGVWRSSEQIDSCKKYREKEGSFGDRDSDDKKILLIDLSEIQEYLPDGHPDKVKNLKLEVGKWYKFLNGSFKFGKYEKIHNSGNRIKFSEIITSTGIYDNKPAHIDFTSNIELLTDLSEIQKYLPNGHPDKVKNFKFEAGKWYKVELSNIFNHYIKVDSVTEEKIILDCEGFVANLERWDKGGISINLGVVTKYELLTDLSKIQKYLPDRHPDKVKNLKLEVGKWYSFNWDWRGKDHIVIAKIKEATNIDIIVSWRNYTWNKADYNTNDGYNLSEISNIKELSIDEVQQYLPDGHPDKIFKQKFEIGKWYKWYQKNHQIYHYGKVRTINTYTDTIVMAPWIMDCKTYNNLGYFDLLKVKEIQEISVEEIQEYLPDGHIDKFCESCNGEGETMIAKLYPSGHTEVTDTCPDCSGTGFTNNVDKLPSDVFKKGEYIVITDKFDSRIKDFVSNHIYKQRKDSTYLHPEYDSLLSKTNGWIKYKPEYPNWRYATQEEIDEYERRGEPYDVTELNKRSFPEEGYTVVTDNPKNLINYLEYHNRKCTHKSGKYNKNTTILAWNKSSYWFCAVGSSKREYSKDHIEEIIEQSIYSDNLLETKKELSMKEIQEECMKRFPIGCTYIDTDGDKHVLKKDSYTYEIRLNMIFAHSGAGCLYKNGKWAKLVSSPKQNDLKEEVIKYSEERNATILLASGIKSKELYSKYEETLLSVKLLSNKTTHLINNVRVISSVNLKIK